MHPSVQQKIETVTGGKVILSAGLSGGCVGDVFRLELSDGTKLVAKTGDEDAGLEIEGWMLRYLKDNSALPVPGVIHADPGLLLMTFIEAAGRLNAKTQEDAGRLVASLHNIKGQSFGLERDTVVGGLPQPNPETKKWLPFFRDQRLLFMGRCALDAGRMPGSLMGRLEKFSGNLDRFLLEPTYPSLIHGDMWTGNVLAGKNKIAGFVDPALYYAHAEIELAFTTLFGTFGEAFFKSYREMRPIEPGFFEERRDLYNLYPLLVHVRLFGGSYVNSVDGVLRKVGF